jgi:nitrogen regulatory protein PII
LLAVGSEWGSYAAAPAIGGGARRAVREAAEEASEQLARQTVRNTVPRRVARVISIDLEVARMIERTKTLPFLTLGRLGAADVFITAASDIRRIRTARGLARRLTLVDEAGNLDIRPKLVLEFDTPLNGIASPVFRSTPGFVGRGRTAGGAREFVVPNLPLSELKNLTWRLVY